MKKIIEFYHSITHIHISAIQYASENGHTDIVRILLADERVDPSTDNNCGNNKTTLSKKIHYYQLNQTYQPFDLLHVMVTQTL